MTCVSGVVKAPSQAVPAGGSAYLRHVAAQAEMKVPEGTEAREFVLAKKRREVAGQRANRDTY